MVVQTAIGWLLDVYATDDINLLVKSQDGKVISFKQKLKEHIFYILPRSHLAGQDLYQQLSRNDQLVSSIFWDEKYIDLADRNKTRLIGIALENCQSQPYQGFIKKLTMDSRVHSLYNTELSAIHQFIYNQLKIAPTSRVRIEYDQEELLSISGIDERQEIAVPPFKIIYIRINGDVKNNETKLNLRLENQTSMICDGLSDKSLIFYIDKNKPDIAIIYTDNQLNHSTLTSLRNIINQYSDKIVVISARDSNEDIFLVELVEKSRFSYLPLKHVLRYGMLRLIDSRITYELLNRDFVIPKRKSVSKYREQIRTLENIVEMDKAGMIISPEIGLHENVAVLDFNDEYANIITGHNISYENLSRDHRSTLEEERISILPSIVEELVANRVWLKQFLKTQQPESFHYSNCQVRLDILKQILVCLYGTSGSIWNRYSNVQVFEEINRVARPVLLKTKDIVQSAGFDLIYADTDAVFLKRKDATRKDFEKITDELICETGLQMTLEFHYKFLVLLYIEADEKMEAKKHYFGLTYDNELITRGIDTRRHDSPVFIKEFQRKLLAKLFDCNTAQEVLTTGYENALLCVTQTMDKLMNGEVQITDLVVSKLLRKNIEKYRSLFPHVAAAIRLNVSGVIAGRGDNIQYVHTDSNHTDPLQRVVPAKLISSENYDREKYLEILLDSAESVLSIFGFNRSVFGFEKKKTYHWWSEIY